MNTVEVRIDEIKQDFQDRIENIEAIKGEKFANAVKFAAILKQTIERTLSAIPDSVIKHLVHMAAVTQSAQLIQMYFKSLGIEQSQLQEIIKMASDLSENTDQQLDLLAKEIE